MSFRRSFGGGGGDCQVDVGWGLSAGRDRVGRAGGGWEELGVLWWGWGVGEAG